MSQPASRLATYEDILALTEHLTGEIIAGELVTQPRPAPRHALAASLLGGVIVNRYDRSSLDGPGGWWILDEPECHLGADVVVPDIAGWRQATMPQLPDSAWFGIASDWVCEIVSPSTQNNDRSAKRDIYARENISHYWIVDPIARLIEVFSLADGRWVLTTMVKDDATVALEPFEDMPFDLARLWA